MCSIFSLQFTLWQEVLRKPGIHMVGSQEQFEGVSQGKRYFHLCQDLSYSWTTEPEMWEPTIWILQQESVLHTSHWSEWGYMQKQNSFTKWWLGNNHSLQLWEEMLSSGLPPQPASEKQQTCMGCCSQYSLHTLPGFPLSFEQDMP